MRKNNIQEVILLDNGDILQGEPVVYFSNYMDTASIHVCAAAMNFMEYDAATVGNHDIEAGHDYSYGGQLKDEPGNENGSLLVAEQVPGFDVIFIGHDHDILLDSLINSAGETVYIVDPGSHARYAGVADVFLKFDHRRGKYDKKIFLELVDVSEYDPDPEFLDHLLKLELNDQGEPVRSGPGSAARLSGRYYNFDSAAGINYVVDVSKPVGERITITTFTNGSPFEEGKRERQKDPFSV